MITHYLYDTYSLKGAFTPFVVRRSGKLAPVPCPNARLIISGETVALYAVGCHIMGT